MSQDMFNGMIAIKTELCDRDQKLSLAMQCWQMAVGGCEWDWRDEVQVVSGRISPNSCHQLGIRV
jgi:hypothetical protein